MEEQFEECSVCYAEYNVPDFKLYCQHLLCCPCYGKIASSNPTPRCPICRQHIVLLVRRPIKRIRLSRFQNIRSLMLYKYSLFKHNQKRSKERTWKHRILRLALGIIL